MNEIQYIGEHLWPGRAGHFLLILSFVGSLLAVVSYFFATQRRETKEFVGWRNLGRFGFLTHSLGILAVIGIIFFIMTEQ